MGIWTDHIASIEYKMQSKSFITWLVFENTIVLGNVIRLHGNLTCLPGNLTRLNGNMIRQPSHVTPLHNHGPMTIWRTRRTFSHRQKHVSNLPKAGGLPRALTLFDSVQLKNWNKNTINLKIRDTSWNRVIWQVGAIQVSSYPAWAKALFLLKLKNVA